MSMPFDRSVVLPVSFIVCAIAATFAPAVNSSFSLFLLVLAAALSTTVYALWHEAPVTVPVSAGRDRREGVR